MRSICKKCGAVWELPNSARGQQGRCTCGNVFIVGDDIPATVKCKPVSSSDGIPPYFRDKSTRQFAYLRQCVMEGSDIVQISVSGSDCPICEPYEGRLFSITGATPGLPRLETAIASGLFHKKCSHRACAVPESIAQSNYDKDGFKKGIARKPQPAQTPSKPPRQESEREYTFYCPYCRQKYTGPSEYINMRIECHYCHRKIALKPEKS